MVKGTNIVAHLHDQRFRQKLGRSSTKFLVQVYQIKELWPKFFMENFDCVNNKYLFTKLDYQNVMEIQQNFWIYLYKWYDCRTSGWVPWINQKLNRMSVDGQMTEPYERGNNAHTFHLYNNLGCILHTRSLKRK